MKKIFFSLFFVLLISMAVQSQSIKVTYPNTGNVILIGDSEMIKWTTAGNMVSGFIINIFKGSIAQPNFVEQLKVTGANQVKWIVSKKYLPGKYVIRVKTADNKVKGDSSVFELKEKAASPGDNTVHRFDPNQFQVAPGTFPPNQMTLDQVKGPEIVYFQPDKNTVNKGEAVLLKFHYRDATKTQLFNRWTGKEILFAPRYPEMQSFIEVHPDVTTRYELVVIGGLKKVAKDFSVTVKSAPPPPPPPPPGNDPLPRVEIFKAVPEVVEYDKGTELKLKATNASSIVIRDESQQIIFSWSGKLTDVVEKNITVKLVAERNTYSLKASNNAGDFFGKAWARWRSVIREFSIKSVNSREIVFRYSYALAETAKIKKLNAASNQWENVLVLTCYGLTCSDEKPVPYAPGQYKLILNGREGVFESDIVKVN